MSTEATPENMPDLDGYTVREAWEHGWHRGYAAAADRIEELEDTLRSIVVDAEKVLYPLMEVER